MDIPLEENTDLEQVMDENMGEILGENLLE